MCPNRFSRVCMPSLPTTARTLCRAFVLALITSIATAPDAASQAPSAPIVSASVDASNVELLGTIESDPTVTTVRADTALLASLDRSQASSFVFDRPQNLGPAINSSETELGPVISPDGRTLFFTRGGAAGNQDIWYSRVDASGAWSKATRMPDPLTNRYNNFVESVTPDGNTLLVGGRYLGYNTIVTGLAVSHRTLDGWSQPEALRIRNYYSRSRSVSSCLGSDGRTLVMSLERDSGLGRQDLHVSFLRDGGEWTEPMNLGGIINSEEIDFAPFLAADGVTLYFSSKGHRGFGDADIFVTRRLDSTWRNWSKPQNLGATINSEGWDAYYVIPASGEYVYFGSVNSAIGESDLLRVALPRQVRPNPVALMSGRVVDARTQQPVAATIRYETLPDGIDAGVARTDPRTGSYAIALPAGRSYAFRAEADGFLGVGSSVDLTSLDSYSEQSQDLAMVPFAAGEVVGLTNIFFDFAQSGLRVESFPELNRLSTLLKNNPGLEIEIEGHTDFVGTPDANERLSEARVRSVVTYLTHQGVDPCRLHIERLGETRPVAPNHTDEGRARNRRVEFRIVRK